MVDRRLRRYGCSSARAERGSGFQAPAKYSAPGARWYRIGRGVLYGGGRRAAIRERGRRDVGRGRAVRARPLLTTETQGKCGGPAGRDAIYGSEGAGGGDSRIADSAARNANFAFLPAPASARKISPGGRDGTHGPQEGFYRAGNAESPGVGVELAPASPRATLRPRGAPRGGGGRAGGIAGLVARLATPAVIQRAPAGRTNEKAGRNETDQKDKTVRIE
jgi:hypothetical protein